MPLSPLRRAAVIALLALPWLWPFTSGPTAGTQPYLVSAACAGLLLALWPARAPQGGAGLAASGWLLAAGVSAVIALLQYLHLEQPLYPWVDMAQPGLAFGNLRQPNQLATLLAIGLAALGWALRGGHLRRTWAAALAALLVAALAATASRVGLVELLALALLAIWWAHAADGLRRRSVASVVAALLALYVLAALALPWLLEFSQGVAGRSVLMRLVTAESICGSRLTLYHNVLHLIAQKPWTGWGWGELAWAHYITLYDGPRFCNILDNAHNLPLHLAVTLGVPVALAACVGAAWLVWRSRPWAERQPARQLAWAVLALIGIHSLVEYPLWYGPFQIAALLALWLLWATRGSGVAAARTTGGAAAWRGVVVAAVLAATAYAGWDYHRISQIYLPAEQRDAAYRDDPMAAARQSWLFAGAVQFADVTTRPVVRDNAAWMLAHALQALHYSPEPRVITRVIESATLLGDDALALAQLARFRAAFPVEYRAWTEDNRRALEGARELLGAGSAAGR